SRCWPLSHGLCHSLLPTGDRSDMMHVHMREHNLVRMACMVWAKTIARPGQRGKIVADPAVKLSPADGIALARHRPGLACTASLKLGAAPGSPRAARDFTAAVLRTWNLAAALPDAQLVISELVTNAIRHGLAAA